LNAERAEVGEAAQGVRRNGVRAWAERMFTSLDFLEGWKERMGVRMLTWDVEQSRRTEVGDELVGVELLREEAGDLEDLLARNTHANS